MSHVDETEMQKDMVHLFRGHLGSPSLCAGGHRLTVIAAETRSPEASTNHPAPSLLWAV